MGGEKILVSKEELVEASKHLHYEIEMIRKNLQTLRSIEANHNSPVRFVKYSFVESFLVHARNLYDFLFRVGPRTRFAEDDIRAGDFLGNEIWEKPPISSDLEKWYTTMINKRLVHLTYHRLYIEEFEQQWQVGTMYAELERALLSFYRKVNPENLCGALQEERQFALERAARPRTKSQAMEQEAVTNYATGTASESPPFFFGQGQDQGNQT